MNFRVLTFVLGILFCAAPAGASPVVYNLNETGAVTITGTVSVDGNSVVGIDIDAGSFGHFTDVYFQGDFTGGQYELTSFNPDYLFLLFITDKASFFAGETSSTRSSFQNQTTGAFEGRSAGFIEVASAVPEPSSWAMMVLGFAGVAFLAYRRQKQTPALTAA